MFIHYYYIIIIIFTMGSTGYLFPEMDNRSAAVLNPSEVFILSFIVLQLKYKIR